MRTAPFLLALALAALAACGDDDSSDPTQPHEVPVLEIDATHESVCLQIEADLPDEVETLPVIGCEVPHTHEIYAELEYTEKDVYPGEEALSSFAQVQCLGVAFEPFVGISAFDSSLSYTWLVPSLKSWNDEDDRAVFCVLANRDKSEPLVGSMRHSQA